MAATTGPETPRQKMINLMYIILTAMLALNVSSDVLNGFSLVENSLSKSAKNASTQNNALYKDLETYYKTNPEKAKEWYDKGMHIKDLSDSLYNYAQALKQKIVLYSDGEEGDVSQIKNVDDLEASNHVMLSAEGHGEAQKLYKAINLYKDEAVKMIDNPAKKALIRDNLSTDLSKEAKGNNKNWEQSMFENMPVAAAVTILTKLQNDVRATESEIVHTLVKNIDVGDFRVNQIKAYVIPNSRNVIRGGTYSAQLVLSAEDSTQRPRYFINNKQLEQSKLGKYELRCNKTGDFTLKGYIAMEKGDGTITKHPFSQPYSVVEPTATVSPMLVNVLYAGIENPLEISVPAKALSQVSASITNGNGTLVRRNNIWVAKPTKIGEKCIVAVTAKVDGRSQVVANKEFRVRALPQPLPFIVYRDSKGALQRYKGGGTLSKKNLLASDGIIAALDDDFLDVKYRVLSFETTFIDSMGDAALERSEGTTFSSRMKERFRKLHRGSRFFISRVRAIGPDGVEQMLPSIEVVIK